MTTAQPQEVHMIDVTETLGEATLVVRNRQVLAEKIREWLYTPGRGRGVVLDFTQTTYIDSSGLSTLVSVNKEVRTEGAEFILAGLNHDLSELFRLTKLDTLFRLADTPEGAVRALQRSAV